MNLSMSSSCVALQPRLGEDDSERTKEEFRRIFEFGKYESLSKRLHYALDGSASALCNEFDRLCIERLDEIVSE